MRLRFLTLAFVAVGIVAGLTGALVFWAVQEWADPALPSIYMGLALVAIYVPTVYLWYRTTKAELVRGLGGGGESAEERGLKRLVGLVFQVMMGVLGIFVVSLWNFDVVRARVISEGPNRDSMRIGRALLDRSPLVRQEACKAAFADGAAGALPTLIASLDSHPAAAAKCLSFAKERDAYGHQILARRLLDGWERQLLGAGDGAQSVCGLARFITPVSAMAENDDSDLVLLQCAMASSSGEVRGCCADELKAKGRLLDQMGLPESIPTDTAINMLPYLVNQSFRPLELEASDQTLGQKLKMEEEKSRRWVMELSCYLFGQGRDRDVIRGLVPLFESNTCGLKQDGRVVYVRPDSWVPICDKVINAPGDDVEATVCRAFTDGLLEIAIDQAQSFVKTSTSSMRLADTSEEIRRGSAGAAAAKWRDDSQNPANWDLHHFEAKPKRISGGSSLCVKRSMGPGYGRSWSHKNGPPVKEIATFDCEPQFGLDDTLASWKKENDERMKALLKDGPVVGAGDDTKLNKKYGKAAVRSARQKMQKHWKKNRK